MKPGPRKGSHHKNKDFLLNRLRDMYGDDFEPVMQMSKNAFFLQGIADEAQAKVAELKAAEVVDLEEIKKAMNEARTLLKEVNSEWDRVAKYVTPQLKAQEVTFPEGIEVKAKPESDIELTRKLAFILSRAAIAKASEESKETF